MKLWALECTLTDLSLRLNVLYYLIPPQRESGAPDKRVLVYDFVFLLWTKSQPHHQSVD